MHPQTTKANGHAVPNPILIHSTEEEERRKVDHRMVVKTNEEEEEVGTTEW